MFRRILREPLVHFLVLALLIFAAYGLLSRQGLSAKERIEVSGARIEQLAGLFAKSWQRPPTPQELKGLIDDYVTSEIYYREALAIGLDADDSVIRQRLRMKMELLNDVAVDMLSPSEEELARYLAAHAGQFQAEPEIAVEQIYLSPEKRGAALESDAASLLARLRDGTITDWAGSGDPTLLPQAMPLAPLSAISRDFGESFADAVSRLPAGAWSGPVASGYGLHLVRVGDRIAARTPALPEVRDAVLREWKAEKRKEIRQRKLAEYAGKYDIAIEPLGLPGVPAAGAKP